MSTALRLLTCAALLLTGCGGSANLQGTRETRIPPGVSTSDLGKQRNVTAKGQETVIRGRKQSGEPPSYPSTSLARGAQGVAVALIFAGVDGHVEQVTTLESPDTDIGAAVETALKQWHFQPLQIDGSDVRMSGKLTFYFLIRNGGGHVVEPADMPRASRDPSSLPIQPARSPEGIR